MNYALFKLWKKNSNYLDRQNDKFYLIASHIVKQGLNLILIMMITTSCIAHFTITNTFISKGGYSRDYRQKFLIGSSQSEYVRQKRSSDINLGKKLISFITTVLQNEMLLKIL